MALTSRLAAAGAIKGAIEDIFTVDSTTGQATAVTVNGVSTGLAASYTWATKPLASAYIGTAFISDIGGGTYWVSNGTKWRPMNGRCLYDDLASDTTTAAITSATPIVARNIAFPANFWQDRDTIGLRLKAQKNVGVADTLAIQLYVGSTTALGTAMISNAVTLAMPVLATTTIFSATYFRLQRISSTSLRFLGNTAGGNENSTSTNAAFTVTGLPSMDAAFYIQLAVSRTAGVGGTETITLTNSQVEIESVLGS